MAIVAEPVTLSAVRVRPEVRAKFVAVMLVATKLVVVSLATTREPNVVPALTDNDVSVDNPDTVRAPVVVATVTFKLLVVVETAETVFSVDKPVTNKELVV